MTDLLYTIEPEIKLLTDTAKVPTKAYSDDACWDIYADEDVTLMAPRQITLTGATLNNEVEVIGYYQKRWPNVRYQIDHIWGGHHLKFWNNNAVKTGIALAIPSGYAVVIKPRSGMAYKHGVDTFAGVIDASWRDEILVLSQPEEDIEIKKGDRIAQFRFERVIPVNWKCVDELSDGERGDKGFGSSGR